MMEPSTAPDKPSNPTIVGEAHAHVSSKSSNAVNQLAQKLLSCKVTNGWNFSYLPDFGDRDLKDISSQTDPIKFLNFFETRVTGNGLLDAFYVKEGCSTRLSLVDVPHSHPFLGERDVQDAQIPEEAIAGALLPTKKAGQIARLSLPVKGGSGKHLLSTLKGLVLTGIPYTAGMRTFLEKLSSTTHQLTELYIGGPCEDKKGKGDKELSALFRSNADLNIVSLSQLVLPADSLQALGQKVQELKLVSCQLLPEAFQKFAEKDVRILSIKDCDGLTSGHLRAIAASDTLAELYLGFLTLPKDAFEILKGCRNLKLLCICDCRNLEGQWSQLPAFPSLTTLEIDDEPMNPESEEALDQLVKRSPAFEIHILGEFQSESESESGSGDSSASC